MTDESWVDPYWYCLVPPEYQERFKQQYPDLCDEVEFYMEVIEERAVSVIGRVCCTDTQIDVPKEWLHANGSPKKHE